MRTPIGCFIVMAVIVSPGGCGSSAKDTCDVRGTVTWNGKPVPEGRILFVSEDGTGVPDSGKIEEGEFRLQVKPGRKKVQIHAEREVGEPDRMMGAVPRKPYIPPKYNVNTTLQVEVAPGGRNEFPFTLEGPES